MIKTPSGLTGMQRRYAKTTPEKRPTDTLASPPSKGKEARAEDPVESGGTPSERAAAAKKPKK
ncbi:MAG: hypothetical protein ACHQAQ_06275 [Hyphomicrobiales bacterium]